MTIGGDQIYVSHHKKSVGLYQMILKFNGRFGQDKD